MNRTAAIANHLGEESLLLPRTVLAALERGERARSLLAMLRRTRPRPDGDSPWKPQEVAEALAEEVRQMLTPLRLEDELRCAGFARRLDSLLAEGEGPEDDFHRLLADLGRELDRMAHDQQPAEVAGAETYRLEPRDRPRVERFMAGIVATASRKLEHPGLTATAARHGAHLVIQNDVGTTEAQALVAHLGEQEAVLTYTDEHVARVAFFQRLLEPFPISWQEVQRRPGEGLRESDHYFLVQGTLEVEGDREMLRFLEHLGSRLVFLIDWNKASKRLRRLLSRRAALDLLDRAAREGWSHRAFLELGADRLVREVLAEAGVELAADAKLHTAVGRNGARELMALVLETCSRRRLQGTARETVRRELVTAVRRRFCDHGPSAGSAAAAAAIATAPAAKGDVPGPSQTPPPGSRRKRTGHPPASGRRRLRPIGA